MIWAILIIIEVKIWRTASRKTVEVRESDPLANDVSGDDKSKIELFPG